MGRLFTLTENNNGFLLSATDKGKPFVVYLSDSPSSFDRSSPASFSNEISIDWKNEARLFCHIFWDDNYSVVSNQEIKAGSNYNLRDLGGYLNASKDAVIKFGLLYRSDQPSSMGEDAARVYEDLGLKTVLDFRGIYEHIMWPDPELPGVANYWLPVQEENPSSPPEHVVVQSLADIFKHDDSWKAEDAVRFSQSYLTMPFDNPAYKKMFSCLLNNEVPMMIHCLAGKDRTGIGAMLILLALGIPEETIMEDYMHRSSAYQNYIDFRENELSEHLATDISYKHFSYFFGVLKENLEGSLSKIHKLYGDAETFLKDSYDLDASDLKRLRDTYLLPIKLNIST
ncbi:MAG: tyrosine-protein phosphatase [Oscillospiraceae bacterium]|nr:tyrosine-protein phosphatase [Oscillospiraceae bacterium]